VRVAGFKRQQRDGDDNFISFSGYRGEGDDTMDTT
jgi:hypothetical protein